MSDITQGFDNLGIMVRNEIKALEKRVDDLACQVDHWDTAANGLPLMGTEVEFHAIEKRLKALENPETPEPIFVNVDRLQYSQADLDAAVKAERENCKGRIEKRFERCSNECGSEVIATWMGVALRAIEATDDK